MFAKKKIVLNSAVNDNKKGIAEITRLDSLTHLQIKISNYAPNKHSSYIFLLKNNGIQQRFVMNDPSFYECDVEVPIDLEQKISCLLIENGAQQTPIFWGGTDTKNKTMNSIDNEINHNISSTTNNKSNNNATQNFNNQQSINNNNTYTLSNAPIDTTSNLEPTSLQPTSQPINLDNSPSVDSTNNKTPVVDNDNLQLHKVDSQEALFEDGDIEKEIDNCMQFEVVKDYVEHDFPQCANCKYKEVFFREKQMTEAKEQLHKIADLQNKENINSTALQNSQIDSNFIDNTPHCAQNCIGNNTTTMDSTNNTTHNTTTIFNTNNTPFFDEDNNTDNNNDSDSPNAPTKTPYYYSLIKTQYEDMFNKYPAFDKLSQIIENSKWIMVDSIDEPYIMGIIYNDNQPQYLCYGVIQERKQTPPVELIDSSQWVPFDINNEFGAGAYIMYQSAENGETLKVEVC